MEKTLKQDSSDCIRVCLFGPESSGKTTLSQKLSSHYNAPLVPEFARAYLQNLWEKESKVCRPKDILPIVSGQMELENEALKKADHLIICDTDALTTKVYSEAYYDGWCPESLSKVVANNNYDLYLLTYIDTPWEADDLRDRPEQREEMFLHFKNALDNYGFNYILIKGSLEERVKTATNAINTLLI